MNDTKPQIVEFLIVSGDDALADTVKHGLDALETANPVLRFRDYEQALAYLESSDNGGKAAPPIVVLDMRAADGNGNYFLDEVHRRRPYAEPIVFVVTDTERDEQEAAVTAEEKRRYVAGRLPPEGTAEALLGRITGTLGENWRFESIDAD